MSDTGAPPFIIRSRRVVLSPTQAPSAAALFIEDGKIAQVLDFNRTTPLPLLDVGDSVLMAGIVDTHAHINEPGRTEWEGFRTATRAAAAGGITTVLDMPLNSIPPTTTLAALHRKSTEATGQCTIDYGFWGGLIPGNAAELEPMIRAGIWGFKAFLCESGVDEFPMADEATLRQGMAVLAKRGVPLLVHAELCPTTLASSKSTNPRRYQDYLASRPALWEVEAVRLMIRLVRETRCPVHIVHLSASDALADLTAARSEGLPITVETCPHYLALKAEDIADGATHFKCAPPIRDALNQNNLWAALEAGHIDLIVSDHSPCTPGLKQLESGDFANAWGGISGLQFSLPVVWTAMKRRHLPLQNLARWMCLGPARMAGLEERKGTLAAGKDADLVVWDPEGSFVATAENTFHRHSLTPYAGQALYGKVEMTFVRGVCVYADGRFPTEPGGTELSRFAEEGK